MLFSVADLLKGPQGAANVFQVDEEPRFELEGARLLGNVTGVVELLRTQQGILVRSDLTVQAEVPCARCLKPKVTALLAQIEDEFRPTVDVFTGHRIFPEPEEFLDEDVLIDAQHVLNLDEPARQEFQLAIPTKPLCHEECVGLCSQCGKDLNEGECDCPPEGAELWSGLRHLLSEGATQ